MCRNTNDAKRRTISLSSGGYSPDKTGAAGSSPQWPTINVKGRSLDQFSPEVGSTQHGLNQFIDGFLLTCKLEGKATETCKGYERILGCYCDYTNAKEWTNPTEIQAFFGYVKDIHGLSQASIQEYEVALKSFFHWLIDEGFIEHNPMTKVQIAKAPKPLVKALSPEQLELLLGSLQARKIEDTKSITLKNGRPAMQGVCPVCGTKMFRIGKS